MPKRFYAFWQLTPDLTELTERSYLPTEVVMGATTGTTLEAMETTMGTTMGTTMEATETIEVIIAKTTLSWLTVSSVVVCDLVAIILASYFSTVLPTKRNLLTKLDGLLVLSLTVTANIWVSSKVH